MTCLTLIFFYFFSPGVFLGGINYLSEENTVIVHRLVHTRTSIDDTYFFPVTEIVEYELNAEQIMELRRLLRNSWYRRRFADWITYGIPLTTKSFYTYRIFISNTERSIILSILPGGFLERGWGYDDKFRIRNSTWEETLLRILSSCE